MDTDTLTPTERDVVQGRLVQPFFTVSPTDSTVKYRCRDDECRFTVTFARDGRKGSAKRVGVLEKHLADAHNVVRDQPKRVRGDVLVRPGWPFGVCPAHMLTEVKCGSYCMAARIALRQLQDDYDRYWLAVA